MGRMHHEGRIEEETRRKTPIISLCRTISFAGQTFTSHPQLSSDSNHIVISQLDNTAEVMLVLPDVSLWEIITRDIETMQCLKILNNLHK